MNDIRSLNQDAGSRSACGLSGIGTWPAGKFPQRYYLLLGLVFLCGCGTSNEGLFLKQIDQVRQGVSESIDIREIPLSGGELLAELQGLDSLQVLNLDHSPISNEAVASIGVLPDLRSLSLTRTAITDEAIETIVAQFPNLTYLRLDETMISDRGLKPLSELGRLRELSLYRTRVSDPGCETLSRIESLVNVSLDQTLVTDQSLNHLAGMPNLRRVKVWQTNVTDEAIERFQKRWPETKVSR